METSEAQDHPRRKTISLYLFNKKEGEGEKEGQNELINENKAGRIILGNKQLKEIMKSKKNHIDLNEESENGRVAGIVES